MRFVLLISLALIFSSCIQNDTNNTARYKKEVLDSELAFAHMAMESGIDSAFLHFAAPEAVLLRNEKILKGTDVFKKYFSNPIWKTANLQWKPAFVEVSASGDLAYTWGPYQYSNVDSAGKVTESSGIFHTVWKRQPDGQWKYVWD